MLRNHPSGVGALVVDLINYQRRYSDSPSSPYAAGLIIVRRNLEDAELLYHKSLAMRRSQFGDELPRVAIALNNLGVLLRESGSRGSLDR